MKPSRTAAKRKRASKQNHWFAPGELSRSVLDALRAAGEPVGIADVAERIMARKGLDAGDTRALEQISTRRWAITLRRRRPAFVERLRGGGRGVLWRIGREAAAEY